MARQSFFTFPLRVLGVSAVNREFSGRSFPIQGVSAQVANCDAKNSPNVTGCDAGNRSSDRMINEDSRCKISINRDQCPILSSKNGDGTSLKQKKIKGLSEKTQIFNNASFRWDIMGHFGTLAWAKAPGNRVPQTSPAISPASLRTPQPDRNPPRSRRRPGYGPARPSRSSCGWRH